MRIKEIVSCWISNELPWDADTAAIRDSLLEIGFSVARQYENGKVRLKRGSQLGGFDYDSEGVEVQVILECDDHGTNTIHVGNWGTPFEPLRMKPRFRRLAQRFLDDISRVGVVVAKDNEISTVSTQVKDARRIAFAMIGGAVLAAAAIVLIGFSLR